MVSPHARRIGYLGIAGEDLDEYLRRTAPRRLAEMEWMIAEAYVTGEPPRVIRLLLQTKAQMIAQYGIKRHHHRNRSGFNGPMLEQRKKVLAGRATRWVKVPKVA